ncbi:MAG: CBS domain-containing protein [Candidatus Magasanikbacteria bacterium]
MIIFKIIIIMIYLSEILNVSVKDRSERVIGQLKDILIKPQSGTYAPLYFLFIKNKKNKKEFFVPVEFVANFGKRWIALKHLEINIPAVTPENNYLWLAKEILDEQIVDTKGARVVRVNDLKVGPFEDKMCVLGIDVSFRGILRRLGLEWLDVFNLLPITLIDWRNAKQMNGKLQLTTVAEELKHLHPADLANIIEDLSIKQGSTLVDSLAPGAAAAVVEEMDPEIQTMIMHYLGPEKAADIVEKMSVDETVDLLKSLPEDEARRFLERLQTSKSKKIEHLFKYTEDSAGGIMTTDYVEAEPEWSVKMVIEEIKKLSTTLHSILYVYVVDKEDNLKGVISLRSLIISDHSELVKDVMKKMPEGSILKIDQKVNEIIRIMTKYNLYGAAVLDENEKMAGVVTLDDIMRFVDPNA